MSQPKKLDQITNRELFERLRRLPYLYQMNLPTFITYVALQLVNGGNVVKISKAVRIIKKAKLIEKLKHNTAIPLENFLESLIHLVVLKRELVKDFIEHPEYEVWTDEYTAPIFDILEQIYKKYRV